MLKKPIFILLILFIFLPSVSMASVIQLADGAYSSTGDLIASINNVDVNSPNGDGILRDAYYFLWTVNDADLGYDPTAIDIVFHHIDERYNSKNTPDMLYVYAKDLSGETPGWWYSGAYDPPNTVGYTYLGSWTDPEDTGVRDPVGDFFNGPYYDVVFRIDSGPALDYFTNGNQFQLLIDPECEYKVAEITIAAVPIPPAILLFGSGLFGLLMLQGRRKHS